MTDYLVTYEEQESVYDLPWDHPYHGGYTKVTVKKSAFVKTLDELHQYRNKSKVRYFEIARELFPTFEIKTIVSI